jgi:hypothetical protein
LNIPIFKLNQSTFDDIIVLISGHASLYVEKVEENITYIERTLFPGDAIGDGPVAFDV